MASNELVVANPQQQRSCALQTLDEIERVGSHIAKSGSYRDIKVVAQAVVKILRGRELGIGPMSSVEGIYVIEGKTTLSANLMLMLLDASKKYDYEVLEATDTVCKIKFLRLEPDGKSWKARGTSTFTIDEAKRADLLKKSNWKNYPSDMLFARALSRGMRRFCPGVGVGVYHYDEMGLDVDGDGNAVNVPVPSTPQQLTSNVSVQDAEVVGEIPAWRSEVERLLKEQDIERKSFLRRLNVTSLDNLSEEQGLNAVQLLVERAAMHQQQSGANNNTKVEV